MNRAEFMEELAIRLAGLPEEERSAALTYYEDYFEDAGVENETEVIRELGSPEMVAESIRADFFGTEFNEEDYSGKNYMEKYGKRSQDTQEEQPVREEERYTGYVENTRPVFEEEKKEKASWMNNGLKIVLILLVVAVACPVVFGIGGAVFGLAGGVLSVLFVLPCLVLAGMAVAGAGIAVVVSGVTLIPGGIADFFVVSGAGMIVLVIGMLMMAGFGTLCVIVYPALYRGVVNLFRRFRNRGGEI